MSCRSTPILQMRGICKHFPGVHALQDVDLEVQRGEVHALVGENGAGKSTLMHILSGVYQPTDGSFDFNNKTDVFFADEQVAQRQGIAIVFQERSLFGPLSIAENIFTGRQPTGRFGLIDRTEMGKESCRLLAEVGLDVDPRLPVDQLSPHHQQLVEVAKALSLNAQLIIFDEPTAALTETETDHLFAVIKKLQERQAAVIYISHRLEEIFQLANRVTVLKDGRLQATLTVAETSPQELVTQMVGRELATESFSRDAPPPDQLPVLEVKNLSDASWGSPDRVQLKEISFAARAGEVVALAGLAGAGRTEIALAVFGARHGTQGTILVDGEAVQQGSASRRSVAGSIAAGIGYLPEDRKEAGLFLEKSIAGNIAAASLKQFGLFWTRDRQIAKVADDYCQSLQVAARDVGQSVVSLSGGNQQKVLLAKWLLVRPKVLIVDEPTRGVDVGAKAEIHRLLFELSRQGTAVVVISSDLPEVLAVADRVLVIAEGRITGELSHEGATEEQIMHLASQVEAA